MADGKTTFGWVIAPRADARAGAPLAASDPTATGRALLDADSAFIRALPPAFDALWVEDHFQWGGDPTLEAFTTMAYFAAQYQDKRMGSIVLGQSYRNPALTAKMAATLQLLTGGRFILGLGAGWKQDEYEAYGYPYPGIATRIAQLEDAAQIIKTMFGESPATFTGAQYSVSNAYCEPRPNPPVPLLIGGGGEQKTLRVVARYADMWNWNFKPSEVYAARQAVLAQHCAAVGRDPKSIAHTFYALIDLSEAQNQAGWRNQLYIHGGSPADVAAEMQNFIRLGVQHIMINFVDFPSHVGLERFTHEVLPALDLG
jgi:alkanesulfonate monooxygenase SsuD/methylene tetrahydromethanopterin reductase-like flavin-dependent oxidoreductase (luciferase family)